MANAGVEYMVSESQGLNPGSLNSLTDFVAIEFWGECWKDYILRNLSLVEPETPAVIFIVLDRLSTLVTPFHLKTICGECRWNYMP